MPWLWLLIGIVALVGHGALWVGLVNKLHATALPRWLIKGSTPVLHCALLSIPPLIGWFIYRHGSRLDESSAPIILILIGSYSLICLLIAISHLPGWFAGRISSSRSAVLIDRVTDIHMTQRLGSAPVAGLATSAFARLPGNQLLHLAVHEKELLVPRLPDALVGLSIVHLSDLHFAGHVTAPYFREVFSIVNDLTPEMILITGDICDRTSCVPWAAEALGELRSDHGTFYILGNHDLRVRPISKLRTALAKAGLIDVGGKWHSLHVRGQEVLLAGNELPWWGPAADPLNEPPAANGKQPLRILLAHTPDQYEWAQALEFDLMFAGHTHGGQICFPWVGPVVCPSRYGVKYASGTHHHGPTVLHVSRGVSSMAPVRFNCPTEVSKVVLTNAQK